MGITCRILLEGMYIDKTFLLSLSDFMCVGYVYFRKEQPDITASSK